MINNVASSSPIAVFDSCTHSDKSLIANSAAEILAAKSERKYAAFINNSSVEITLILGETNKAALNKGIVLKPGGSYEINSNNLYVGAVSAIAKLGCKLIYVECVE
ncbi:hypothetical protein NIES2109_33970 [Nostoc sp. HK-01]|nr:hypothetical protein NIES2109_33970 [Nostoc sp. HK-01]